MTAEYRTVAWTPRPGRRAGDTAPTTHGAPATATGRARWSRRADAGGRGATGMRRRWLSSRRPAARWAAAAAWGEGAQRQAEVGEDRPDHPRARSPYELVISHNRGVSDAAPDGPPSQRAGVDRVARGGGKGESAPGQRIWRRPVSRGRETARG
jgi:hypothetical protein